MADAPPPATTAAPPPVDVYRDTPLRFAGYANEVGESFKHMAPRWFYYGSYVVSSLYVAADAKDKYDRDGDVAKGADALVWQAPRPRGARRSRARGGDGLVAREGRTRGDRLRAATIGRGAAAAARRSRPRDSPSSQALASVIVPGFVVNRVVAAARLATKLPMTATVAGLASIPIIIKPIDHAVDLGLDATLRPWLFPPKAD